MLLDIFELVAEVVDVVVLLIDSSLDVYSGVPSRRTVMVGMESSFQ